MCGWWNVCGSRGGVRRTAGAALSLRGDCGQSSFQLAESWQSMRPSGRSGSPISPACVLLCRYERERALVQEELSRMARREQEAGREEQSAAMLRERARAREEADRAQQLVSVPSPVPPSRAVPSSRSAKDLHVPKLTCSSAKEGGGDIYINTHTHARAYAHI